MRRLTVAFVLGLSLALAVASAAGAAAPRSILVVPGQVPVFNAGGGNDQPPPHIVIETPHGIVEPTF